MFSTLPQTPCDKLGVYLQGSTTIGDDDAHGVVRRRGGRSEDDLTFAIKIFGILTIERPFDI